MSWKRERIEEEEDKREKKQKVECQTIGNIARQFGTDQDIARLLDPYLIHVLKHIVMEYVAPWNITGVCVGQVPIPDLISTTGYQMACTSNGDLCINCADGIFISSPNGTTKEIMIYGREENYEEFAVYGNCVYFLDRRSLELCQYNTEDGAISKFQKTNLYFHPQDYVLANELYVLVVKTSTSIVTLFDRKTFNYIELKNISHLDDAIHFVLGESQLFILTTTGEFLVVHPKSGELINQWEFPNCLYFGEDAPRFLIIHDKEVLLYFQGSEDVMLFAITDGTPLCTWRLEEPVFGALAYNGTFLFTVDENQVFMYK